MSLTAGACVVVDLRATAVYGTPLLGEYLLRFHIDYTMPSWDDKDYRATDIRARVHVGKKPQLLGVARTDVPIVLASRSHTQAAVFVLEIQLSARQLEEIEKIRLGGELDFKLDVSAQMRSGTSLDWAHDTIHLHVNQKSWIDVLKELHFASIVLLEIPSEGPVENQPAWKALQDAKKHLYYGNYDDVVAACRKAVECIPSDGNEVNRVRNIPISDRRKMTKRDRLILLLDALEHYTHPAHHPESPADPEAYTRKDALLALGAAFSAVTTQIDQQR